LAQVSEFDWAVTRKPHLDQVISAAGLNKRKTPDADEAILMLRALQVRYSYDMYIYIYLFIYTSIYISIYTCIYIFIHIHI
jgi:hypothetical protein